MSHLESYTMETVRLDRIKVAAQTVLSPSVASSLSMEQVQDDVWGSLIYRLKGYVLAETLPPAFETAKHTVDFKRPASWWQAWKDEHRGAWYARWLVRRRPPRWVEEPVEVTLTVDLQRYRTYPEATYQLPPEFGRPVLVHTLSSNTLVERV